MKLNYRELRIRHATPDDTSIIIEAERKITLEPGQLVSQPHELRDEDFRFKIQRLADHPRGVYLVAEVEGHIVGHCVLDPQELQAIQHVAHVTIASHLGHQGNGVGEKLLSGVIEWSRNRSMLEKIEAQICSTNTRALSLHAKLGFKEEGRWLRRVKISDDQYLDNVLLGLWL